jgi:hypothetical protein
MKCYKVNPKSRFPIFIHSLKDLNGDEFINRMKTKVKNSEEFNKKELLMISLLCFMDTETDISDSILSSAETITDITGQDKEMGQFVKGIILMLCDKFVKDELLNKK